MPGREILGRRLRVIDAESLDELFAPRGLSPLEQREIGRDRLRLQEGGRLAGRRQGVPADGQAVTAHVAQHAAALTGRIPEPGVVRPGMLFAGSHEQRRPHRRHHGRHLRPRRLQRLHVQLVLEVDVPQPGVFDEPDHPPRFGQVPRERLFADDAFSGLPPSRRRRLLARARGVRNSAANRAITSTCGAISRIDAKIRPSPSPCDAQIRQARRRPRDTRPATSIPRTAARARS